MICTCVIIKEGGQERDFTAMVYLINGTNWCGAIGEAIRRAADGDTILLDSELKVRLAEKAHRAQCPCKRLIIRVGAEERRAIA